MQRAVFPFFQGTPSLNAIAAKARALARVTAPEFKTLARRIVTNARFLAASLTAKGYTVLTGGSDNHLLLIDVLASGLTGVVAERALEECNIIVNKNKIPGESKSALVTSGLRLGTNSLALRGMESDEMAQCADLIYAVLSGVKVTGDTSYILAGEVKEAVQAKVRVLCRRFPIPFYPVIRALDQEGTDDE